MIFSYDTFNRINESVERVEKNGLVEEGLLAAIKFPIKFTESSKSIALLPKDADLIKCNG